MRPAISRQPPRAWPLPRILARPLILLIAFLLPLSSSGEERMLRSAAEPDYAPLSQVNDQGQPDGFSVELLRAAVRAMGREITFTSRPWSVIKQELAEDHLDVLPLVGRTPEREGIYDFTVPYLSLHGVIVTRTAEEEIFDIEDLRDRRVGVLSGDNAEEYMQRKGLTDTLIATESYPDALRMLDQGELDAVVVQQLVAQQQLDELSLERLEIRTKIADFRQDFCFAVTEGDKVLLSQLNEGLSRILTDGTFATIRDKWLGFLVNGKSHYTPTRRRLTNQEKRWITANRVITLVGEPNALPYLSISPNGVDNGLVADFLHLIEGRTGLRFKVLPAPDHMTAIRMAAEGKVMVIPAEMAEQNRFPKFTPTRHLVENPVVIVMEESRRYVENLAEIRDARIALPRNHGYSRELMQRHPENRFVEVDSIRQALEGVASGRFEATLGTLAQASYYMHELGLDNLRIVGKTDQLVQLALYVTNRAPQLHAIVDKTLAAIPAHEKQQILGRWVHIRYAERIDYRLILLVAVALLLIMLAFSLAWNHQFRDEIRRRQEVERSLKESQALLNEAQSMAHVGNWELDAASGKAIWSEEIFNILGREVREEVDLEVLASVLHPEDKERVLASLNEALQGTHPHHMEYRIVRSDGEERWINCEANLIGDEGTGTSRLRGVIQDITQRKRDSLKTQESEARFRSFFEQNSSVMLLIAPATGAIIDANHQAVRYYRYPRKHLIGMSISQINLLPESEILEERKRALRQERNYFNFKHRLGNGEERDVEVYSTPVKVGEQHLLFSIIHDVTRRKQAEEALERFFEQPLNLHLITQMDGTIERANRGAEAILGYTRGELRGVRFQDLIHPEGQSEVAAHLSRLGQGVTHFNFEQNCRHKAGSYLLLSWSMIASEAEQRIYVAASDITQLKRAERDLRRAQKMDAIGQLTGGIAHDFNNLLSIIMGNLELIRENLPPDSKLTARIESIGRASERAAGLTRQLLTFSRHHPREARVTDVNHLIREMNTLMARTLTPQVEMKSYLAEGLWKTEITPGDLEDSLINLVINARDAMPDGGNLTLETANRTLDATHLQQNPAAQPGEYIEITVSDTGIGIPRELQDRIFEPFYTTKPPGKGTGLGLAMVYGFIKRSGGHVQLYSEEGVGTSFHLYLPRAKQCDRPHEVDSEPEGDTPAVGTETILVVDDEVDLLELAEAILSSNGYRVLTATNGRHALEYLDAEPDIALLFSDVVMPGGISGYDLAERATTTHPHIKVLLASGYTEKALAHDHPLPATVELLTKPYLHKDLLRHVRRLLDTR